MNGTPELLGRDAERQALRAWLDDRNAPAALAISGEAGIGRSRLLAEARALAAQRGYAVLAARASGLEHDVPFGILAEALEEQVAWIDTATLRDLGEQTLSELARVLPSLTGAVQPAHRLPPATLARTADAVGALLDVVAGAAPILISLDDFHDVDVQSAELIVRFLRRSRRPAIRLVVTYRSGALPAPLLPALEVVRDGVGMRTLRLSPLTDAAARQLIGDHLAVPEAQRMIVRAGGVPLFLVALRAARDAAPKPTAAFGLVPTGLPESACHAVAREVATLSDDARALLGGAAVAGDPCTIGLAVAAADLDQDDDTRAARALAELRARELLHDDAERADLLRFRRPILAEVIAATLPPSRRLAAHAGAAAALARAGEPPSAQAEHVARSARIGDGDAVAVLLAAAATVRTADPLRSGRWYRAALELLPAPGAPSRGKLLIELADVLTAAGRSGEARAALARARPLVAPGTPEHRVLLQLETALDDWSGRRRDEPGSPSTLTDAAGHAVRAAAAGDTAAARSLADLAAQMLDAADDRTVADELFAVMELARAELYVDRVAIAAAQLRRALGIAFATGQELAHVPMTALLTIALARLGEVAEAHARIEPAVDISRHAGTDLSRAWALASACWVRMLVGELPGALDAGLEASRLMATPALAGTGVLAHGVCGSALIELGELERGRHRILLLGAPDLQRSVPAERGRWYGYLCVAEIGLGRVDAADDWAFHAQRLADRLDLQSVKGQAVRARARVLLAQDRPDAAAEAAARSAAHFLAASAPVDAARADIVQAHALLALGGERRDDALVLLTSARDTLDRLGARRPADEAAHELRRQGRRVPRRAGAATEVDAHGTLRELSQRQRDVAMLIAGGGTNRAIADALHLSEKTVEKHVSRLLDKLGVRSRAQVAALVGAETRRASEPRTDEADPEST